MELLRVSLRIGGDNCFDLLLAVLLFPLKLCTNNPATTQPNQNPIPLEVNTSKPGGHTPIYKVYGNVSLIT